MTEMAYRSLIPLLAAIASLVLAIIVDRSGPRTPVSRVFSFLACMLVFWNLNFFVLYSVSDYDLAFSLTRTFRLGAFFVPPAILHLIVALRERRHQFWRNVLLANYAIACALMASNSVDLFVTHLRVFSWGYYSVGTRLYDLFSVFVLGNFLATIGLLTHDYRTTTDPRLLLQLKFWLLGILVALPLGLTNLLPAYGLPIYPLGNLGSAAWAAIVAYAIVRHRLMDIDIVFTKGAAYAAVALVLIAPAFVLLLWLQRLSFGQIHPDFSFALILMLLGVGVLFPTLRSQAESRIERSLFREKHEYRRVLAAFTRSIVRILNRDKLLRELASTLSESLQLDHLAIGLAEETRRAFIVRHVVGTPPTSEEFPSTHPFITSLTRRQETVLCDELEASADQTERSVVAEVCRQNGWEVCIPLATGGALIGFISLGRKRNLDAYFAEDLELLGTLAAETSVALENARLYEELKRSQDIIRRADRLSALGTLAAGIAHEIRNPMVSIQTFFQLAPQRLDDHEFLTEFLHLTSGEVKRITDLITELLSFAKSPTPSMAEVNLNEVVDGVVRLVEPQLQKGAIAIRKLLAPHLAPVRADVDQLKQVFLNIILNAIQALDRTGEITVSTREITHNGERLCQVQIADSGKGIPEDLLDHIFNPFFTTKEKGTGLGLSIAHQVITEHGGFITVQSETDHGTTFSVHLRPGQAIDEAADESEQRQAVGGRQKYVSFG